MTKRETAKLATMAGELRVVLGQLMRRLREQSHPGDFTWSQKAVILRLERDGPATVSTLARAENVRPQSMGATVATLEEAGIVYGLPDPSDGRQTIFSITDQCREIIKASRAVREDWLFRTLQAKLSPAEHNELARAVELLKRLVDT